MSTTTKKSGYTLVETVIYVSILAVIILVLIDTLFSFNNSYRNIVALRIVDNSGISAMERITREVRKATMIDTGNSTLGSSPGVLTLITTFGSVSTTTKFYLQNGVIKVDVNGTYSGPLSLASASVTNLVFTKMDSGISYAVKIDMTVTGTSGQATKTRKFHSTVMMKSF